MIDALAPLPVASWGSAAPLPDGAAALAPVLIALDAFAVAAVVILLVAGYGRRVAIASRPHIGSTRSWLHDAGLLVRGTTVGMLLAMLALGATRFASKLEDQSARNSA